MSVVSANFLPLIGKSLNTAERASLQCSLPLLSARFNGAPAELWGKVCGYKNDYLVAQVLPGGALGPRVGFYSVDGGNNWTMLEELTDEQACLCDELRGVYQGVPSYEYKIRKDLPPVADPEVAIPETDEVLKAAKEALAKAKAEAESAEARGGGSDDEDPDEEVNENEEDDEEGDDAEAVEEAAAPPVKKERRPKYLVVSIAETKRLAHFVQRHDACCRLAVRGEYILSPEGGPAATRNRAFAGQPLHYAMKPSCYLRLHAAGQASRNATLYGATYNPHTDFWQPITDDAPRGVWSVKYDPTLNVVAVTNWFFEGALFWYRPDTSEKGQIYYGTGERNFEILFML